ncbi:unnamed protein product [Clavelina lepadiformis]|uniref:N-acetyltransferase domain-containing protein n=1 Tax=Clavelina lepadiformis TaxID=159417 RepID=A0ABP0FH87_CLALP
MATSALSTAQCFVKESTKISLWYCNEKKLNCRKARYVQFMRMALVKKSLNLNTRYQWRHLTVRDHNQVRDFIWKYYSELNPLRRMFCLHKSEKVMAIDDDRVATKLREGVCTGVIDKRSGKLAAVALDAISSGSEEAFRFKCVSKSSQYPPNFYKMLGMFDIVRRCSPRFLKNEKLYQLSMFAIHPDYNGLGLATKLTLKGEENATVTGCKYVVVTST